MRQKVTEATTDFIGSWLNSCKKRDTIASASRNVRPGLSYDSTVKKANFEQASHVMYHDLEYEVGWAWTVRNTRRERLGSTTVPKLLDSQI